MNAELFGSFIQQRRKELGLKQTELAERIHVTDKAVSRWERGVGFPDIKLLEPLAEALELSLTELLQCRILPHLEKEQLGKETERILEEQKKLSWQRKIVLWLGYGIILAAAWFLIYISRSTGLPEIYQSMVYLIAFLGTFFGSHALRFVVERLYLNSNPWGVWEASYKGISALMMTASVILVRFASRASGIWSVLGILAGLTLLAGAYIYYAHHKDKTEEGGSV